jgi:DNA-binding response OmpR family regulator
MTREDHQQMTGQRVLVIDDDPRYLDLLQFTLEAEGFEVSAAKSGVEGMDLAVTHRPDVIVTDVAMPDMDGYVLAAGLKADARTAEIPLIFVTARGLDADRWTGQSVGAVEFLTKPFSIVELVQRIRNSCLARTEKEA